MNPILIWLGGLLLGWSLGMLTAILLWPYPKATREIERVQSQDLRTHENNRLYRNALRGDKTAHLQLQTRAGLTTMQGYGAATAQPWETQYARDHARQLLNKLTLELELQAANAAPEESNDRT